MSVADNFNYNLPTNCRKDLMSFSTINSNDAKIHPFKGIDSKRNWSANLYNLDIEKSYPKPNCIYTNKVDFVNKVDDIPKTCPKFLHYPLNKPNYNLSNEGIPGSSPDLNQLKTSRCTNPLEPKYTLPKTVPYPPPETRFLRDQIDISDIQGAKPKPYIKYEQRETFPIDNGVEGSRPKKEYIRKTHYDYMDYSDVNKVKFKTKRNVSPLDPVYEVKYPNGENYTYGMIEKSKPETVYPYTHPQPFGLRVNDIQGAHAGTSNKINQFNSTNSNMITKDIKGTEVGSFKKGLVTKRNTNPLNPQYQYIGGGEEYYDDDIGKPKKTFIRMVNNKGPIRPPLSARPNININYIPSQNDSKPQSKKSSKPPTPENKNKFNRPKSSYMREPEKMNYISNTEQNYIPYSERNSKISSPIPTPNSKQSTPKNKMERPKSSYIRRTPPNYIPNLEKNELNQMDNNIYTQPHYELIHDRYVCPSDNPEKRYQITQQKVNNLSAKQFDSMAGNKTQQNISNNKSNNQNKFINQGMHDKTIPLTQNLNNDKFKPRCYSAYPNKGLSYEQKLDQFMEDHKLEYIGEPTKLKK